MPVMRAAGRGHGASVVGASSPHAGSQVVEQVVQRLIEGDLGLPAGGRLEAAGVAAQHREVDGAHELGVGYRARSGRSAIAQEPVGQLLDGDVAAGAHVVDLAGLALLDEQAVGPDDVADVGEVAAGREVADGHVVGAVALGPGDAAGQGRGDELLGLARAEVVERPHAEDAEPVAEVGLVGEGVGGDLRGGVRAGGAQRGLLVERAGRPRPRRRRRRRWPRTATRSTPAWRLASRTLRVPSALRTQRALGIAPRGADVGPPGQVVHDLGGGLGDRGERRRRRR